LDLEGLVIAVVTIYGASDDLIEIEGAIAEEFNDFEFRNGVYVYVSTGDVLRFRLGAEGWRAAVVVDATLPRVAYLDGEGDRVTVAGPVTWVVATTVAPAR
jgi:hypothetical protein